MVIDSIEDSIKKLTPYNWESQVWKQAFFALCSRIAYLDGDHARPYFSQMGFSDYIYIDHQGAQCHIFGNSLTIIIAFRGTEPKEFNDIVADLKAWKSKSQTSGRVHDGFYDEVNKIWGEIVTHCKLNGKRVFVTGHSLGGAMASICATRLSANHPELYTYGSPRVGNATWMRNNYLVSHKRFVNNNDAVPKVPPALLGFRHHGELCYINYYGNIRPLTWWQRVKDQWRARKRAWSKGQAFSGFTDHSIDRYCQKLLDYYTNGEKLVY